MLGCLGPSALPFSLRTIPATQRARAIPLLLQTTVSGSRKFKLIDAACKSGLRGAGTRDVRLGRPGANRIASERGQQREVRGSVSGHRAARAVNPQTEERPRRLAGPLHLCGSEYGRGLAPLPFSSPDPSHLWADSRVGLITGWDARRQPGVSWQRNTRAAPPRDRDALTLQAAPQPLCHPGLIGKVLPQSFHT